MDDPKDPLETTGEHRVRLSAKTEALLAKRREQEAAAKAGAATAEATATRVVVVGVRLTFRQYYSIVGNVLFALAVYGMIGALIAMVVSIVGKALTGG